MDIRRAGPRDLDAVERLWREMVRLHQGVDPYFETSPSAEGNHRAYTTRVLADESKRIFVAEDGGRIRGYLVAEINAYPPIYVHERHGHVGAISVTESARREGIGQRLLDAALAWFRDQGVQRVECTVAVENPIARGFWRQAGFRSVLETYVLEL